MIALSIPEVSVAVIAYNIAYNEAHRLPRAVASVVEGPCAGEVIVVEDASTDSTPRVTEQLSAGHPDRVKVIRQLMTHGHDGLIVGPGQHDRVRRRRGPADERRPASSHAGRGGQRIRPAVHRRGRPAAAGNPVRPPATLTT